MSGNMVKCIVKDFLKVIHFGCLIGNPKMHEHQTVSKDVLDHATRQLIDLQQSYVLCQVPPNCVSDAERVCYCLLVLLFLSSQLLGQLLHVHCLLSLQPCTSMSWLEELAKQLLVRISSTRRQWHML